MNIITALNPIKANSLSAQRTALTKFYPVGNSINNKSLTKDTFTYTTTPVSFTGTKTSKENDEKYAEVVETLSLFSDNAQKSFETQYKKGGLFAKSVDAISGLWMSKNRSQLVKKDIEIYNANLETLNKSIKKGNFPEKFEEIFGVKYQQKNIDAFNEANQRLMLASTTQYMSDTVNEKLSKDLSIAEDNKGILKDHVVREFLPYATTGSIPFVYKTTAKETVYKQMETAITDAVGGKEVLANMLESQNLKSEASQEEKYHAYYNIAKFLTKTSKMTAEKCSKGKSQKELKEDYDKAYKEAFGESNDIQKRVDNYNRSQKIGAGMLKSGVKNPVKLALLGLLGLTNPWATIPVGVALSYGFNMLEKATDSVSEKGFSKNTLKELMENTAQSYVDYAIEAGIDAVLPNFKTGNEIINTILTTTRDATINVTTNMVSEYMNTGKWDKSQIAPRAFVTIVFGQISTDDELGKNLLSMTKGGVKDALLYDNSENNSVRQFINKLQVELQKAYMKNPELYSSMKAIALNNPESFEKMVVELLQEHIDKTTSKSKA